MREKLDYPRYERSVIGHYTGWRFVSFFFYETLDLIAITEIGTANLWSLSLLLGGVLKTFGIIKTSAMHPVDHLNSLMHTTTPTTVRANRISRPSK